MGYEKSTSPRKRMCEALKLACAAALTGSLGTAAAEPPKLVEVQPGHNEDIYFEVNASGHVFVKIAAKPGEEACAAFWWIKLPFGNIERLGRQCNFVKFEIPGIGHMAISSRLRIGGTKNVVKVGVHADETVANSIAFSF